MADFHIKDSFGFNYKIGGSASGIYNFPIYKLITVKWKTVAASSSNIPANSGRSFTIDVPDVFENNATYVPIGITGYTVPSSGHMDHGILIRTVYVEGNKLYITFENITSDTNKTIQNISVGVVFVCAKVPWLQV